MSILDGIPPKPAYTKIPTDEWEAVQAELARLKDEVCQYAQNVGKGVLENAEIKALKAENVRLRGGGWLPIGSIVIDAANSSRIEALFYNEINDWFIGYARINKETQTVSYYAYNNGDYSDGGYGEDYRCGVAGYYKFPTHWMPLPLPPKPEGESDVSTI